ncbi:hypothetical protein [Phenylobacterium sp.]|jgi:hypothetical protein|uniref:hypothetical protein n=1 Tax=Phenylobacterium sp. TaxID=1871053 RepID=UPI002F3EED67
MVKERLAAITIVGGTDAPGIQIVSDGHGGWVLKRVPGWNPEAMAELAHGLEVISAGSRLKTSGLAEQVINSVSGLVEQQLGEHVGGAANVVVLRA